MEKIKTFQEHFANFNWERRETFGEDFAALIREGLEAGGFDFESREQIDGFFSEILEPQWAELGRQEKEVLERIENLFRKAGATEAQIKWQLLDNVRLSWRAERQLGRLLERLAEVRERMLPVAGLAAVLNEAREALDAV